MRAVMAFSGGMDSTGLLIRLIADGFKVTCISYNYGQKHIIEIDRAIKNIKYLIFPILHLYLHKKDLN